MPPLEPTLADVAPDGHEWLHEIKHDGYRTQLVINEGEARAFTKRGHDWTARYWPIAQWAQQLPCRQAIIDGEVIVQNEAGRSDIKALKTAIDVDPMRLVFMAFDLLHLDGADLRRQSCEERRARLADLLGENDPALPIHFSEHIVGGGPAFFAAAEAMGLEGIISKRRSSRYRSGPSKAWLKIKAFEESELVVIATATGDRAPVALLAREEARRLVYVGAAMVTLPAPERDIFWTMSDLLKVPEPAIPMERRKETGWLRPEMRVCVRHLRGEDMLRHATVKAITRLPSAPDARSTTPARPTSPYPKPDYNPGEVETYYDSIAPLMLPWLRERPLNLFRCPAEECFFQRHTQHPPTMEGTFGLALRRLRVQQKNGKLEDYLYLEDEAGIEAAVAAQTFEFHGWGSRIADVEKPDRLVIDLDPDVGLDFVRVREAAIELRKRLADLLLLSFPLLTGGKGIHVIVPLVPRAEWPQVREFARSLCAGLADAEPDRFTVALQKVRRRGRIFLDFLRNQRTATAILPYSLRARTGLPVAAPVAWSELASVNCASVYYARDANLLRKRARSKALEGWGVAEQGLPDRALD